MEKFSAKTIYEIGRSLEQLHQVCNIYERLGNVRFKEPTSLQDIKSGYMPETEAIELLTAREIREMTPDWKKALGVILKTIEYHGASIGLTLAVQAAQDYTHDLDSGKLKSYTDAQSAVQALETIMKLQLGEHLFMHVPLERAKFYAQPQLFGEQVSSKFPECQYDIEEAGNCYAAGRGTACAFHLMRIMEVTVKAFGSAMGIDLTEEKDWHNILEEVNKAIKPLNQRNQRAIDLAQIAGYLYNVKVAWRNPTMHPKRTYTLEETSDLVSSVRAFTAELSTTI